MSPRRPYRAVPASLALAAAVAALAGCASETPVETATSALPDVVTRDVPEEHYTDVVALVNGASIYRATYEEILTLLRDQIENSDTGSVQDYIRARGDALERAIDMELLYQEAVRQGYGLSPEDLHEEYARRVGKAGSEEQYLEGAKRYLLTKSEVLEAIRHEMAVQRYLASDIEAHLTVTGEEMRAYYASNPGPFTSERAVKLGSIFIDSPNVAPRAARAAALTRISKALERIRQGEAFEKVAREISEDGAADRDGKLGLVKRGDLPERLADAAFSLSDGEVSGVLESEDGYHLLKVYERVGGDLSPYEAVEEDVRRRVLARKKNEEMYRVVTELRQRAEITRQLSQQPGMGEPPAGGEEGRDGGSS